MYNIFRLPKVYFLQEIPHLDLLVLDKATGVCNVGREIGERAVLFDLNMHQWELNDRAIWGRSGKRS